MSIVTDDDVEKALAFLRRNANVAAKARADRLYLEEFKKTKKALLMQQAAGKVGSAEGNPSMTIGVQEREAYAHPEYLELLEGYRVAIENDEKARFGVLAAQITIDAWRTQESNQRAMGKLQ